VDEARRMLDEFARILPVAPFELCAEPAANRYWFSHFSGGTGSFRSWLSTMQAADGTTYR
jgi:hypothetical protein